MNWIIPISALIVIILNNFLKMSVHQDDVTQVLTLISDIGAAIVLLLHQIKEKK